MKKLLKSLLVVTLALATCLTSIACDGCGEKEVETTGQKIVSSGKTDYKIVVPSGLELSDNETFAATELRELFYESTGITLEIIEDSAELKHDDENKYFSIGGTTLFKTSGVVKDESLGMNGFQIVTKGKTIYFIGKTTNATITSVYEFCERELNFDQFTLEIFQIDKRDDLDLPNYDLKMQPDIAFQEAELREVKSNRQFRQRLRLNTKEEIYLWTEYKATWIHNSFSWFPESIYGTDGTDPHPKWYGANGQQLCYCANGDADELRKMKEVFVATAKKIILEKPENRVIGFTHEDMDIWCSCDACMQSKLKYNTDSAVVIHFLNDVAAELEAWVKTVDEIKNNTYEIMFFAYNPTVNPPANDANGDGVYEPTDTTVKAHPWVGVMLAPILSDQYIPYNSPSTTNDSYMKGLLGWSACCENIYLWVYNYSFVGNLLPFTMQNATQATKKFFVEHGLKGVFEEYVHGNKNTGFTNYTIYLQSKVNWDLDLDLRALTEKFFNGVYGPAADVMYEMYDHVRMSLEYKYRDGTINGDCWSGKNSTRRKRGPTRNLKCIPNI